MFMIALLLGSVDPAATPAPAIADAPDEGQTVTVTGVREQPRYGPTDTSAAKVPIALRDLPQTVSEVSAEVLRDRRALSLQDALKGVAGVSFASGDGQRDQVSIRGFTAIADQYVDGFRDDGLYFRDLSNVDRVEVIEGPAAVLYGRGSSGGLINRVLKKPDRDVVAGAVSAGSFDTYRGEVDLGRYDRAGGVGFRLTGAYENDGSFRQQQFLNRGAVAPSLLIGGGRDTTLLVQADYLDDRRLTDFGIPAVNGRPVNVEPGTYYGAANARDADVAHSRVVSQTVTLTHRFSDALSFRNGFRHYRYTLDRHNTQATVVNAAAGTVTLSHGGILRDEDGWSDQAELTQKLALAGTAHTLLYGVEVARQTKDTVSLRSRVVAVTSLFAPVPPTVDTATFTAASASTLNRFDTLGLYLQDVIDLGHGIKALAGVRYDDFRQRTHQRLPGQPDLQRTDRKWSPRAGLVFQPDGAQSYYVSWSRSFQPSGENSALAATNADIAPEQTVNREVGAKYTLLGGRLQVQAAGFVLTRTGIKGTDPATNLVIPIGTQRTRGAELSAQLDLGTGLHATAGYDYLGTRITASATPSFVNKRATITPVNAANLLVTKTVGRVGGGGGANYVGDRWADPANMTVLPSYVTVDALGWVDVGRVRLQLNAYNLGDRRYIVSGHGTSPLLNQPGSSRTVLGTIRFGW